MPQDIDTAILVLVSRFGAAGASHISESVGLSSGSTAARLRRAVQAGLLDETRLLHGQSPLFTATRSGLRLAGFGHLPQCRVSPVSVRHLGACADVLVAFGNAMPDASLMTERELRAWEGAGCGALASAELDVVPGVEPKLHRPDLVVWDSADAPAVAVEVELTVKGARRLRQIVRGWARCRHVGAVVYYATPPAARALRRAVDDEWASDRVYVCDLVAAGQLPDRARRSQAIDRRSTCPIPSDP